jgi:hypothetical protein
MKEFTFCDSPYKLPHSLNEFQKRMYAHLIEWKWKNITTLPGKHNSHGGEKEYDAVLPENVRDSLPLIYPPVRGELAAHLKLFPFSFHRYFHSMASSQAAVINLFLPLLLHPGANAIFRQVKPGFKSLATDKLYKGFRLGFRGRTGEDCKEVLADYHAGSCTEAGIAIAYYNNGGELCLWLINHKFTEKDFTHCRVSRSKGQDPDRHFCDRPFSEITARKNLCYYHDVKGFRYWELSEAWESFFVNHHELGECPFRCGMNELWRIQLMALAIEAGNEYPNVFLSVVKHPGNNSVDKTINAYKRLIGNDPSFSVINSSEIVSAAQSLNELRLNRWVEWYRGLYMV